MNCHKGSADRAKGCHGRGECGDGECKCDSGFSGQFCEHAQCKNDCSGHGRCSPAHIDGSMPDKHFRADCSKGNCAGGEGPKTGRGANATGSGSIHVHQAGVDNRRWACTCDDGFTGEDCSMLECYLGCSGHGKCRMPDATGSVSMAKPLQIRKDDDDDDADGGAAVVRANATAPVCECDKGFVGQGCEIGRCDSVDPDLTCSGHGTCVMNVSMPRPICFCHGLFGGDDCNTRLCVNNCSNHGICKNGRCACDPQWEGLNCETPHCPGGCHRGVCSDGKCICLPGWTGPDCSSQCPHNCSGHGSCCSKPERNGGLRQCSCDPEWGGADCNQLQCPAMCSGHGKCETPTGDHREKRCVCAAGWHGDGCQSSYCDFGCHGNGVCKPLPDQQAQGKYACSCLPGFTGINCGERDCHAGKLVHGRCVCPPGISGDTCNDVVCVHGSVAWVPSHVLANGTVVAAGTPNSTVTKRPVCTCEKLYGGVSCDRLRCKDHALKYDGQECSGRGICGKDARCMCPVGFSGEACEQYEQPSKTRKCSGYCSKIAQVQCKNRELSGGFLGCLSKVKAECLNDCLDDKPYSDGANSSAGFASSSSNGGSGSEGGDGGVRVDSGSGNINASHGSTFNAATVPVESYPQTCKAEADLAECTPPSAGGTCIKESAASLAKCGCQDRYVGDGLRKGSSCALCGAGSQLVVEKGVPAPGNRRCAACVAGKYSTSNGDECMMCPKGSYAPDEGSTRCLECPADSSTVREGANDVNQCVCNDGFVSVIGNDGSMSCKQFGTSKVGDTCKSSLDCASKACDEWGMFPQSGGCKGKCVIEKRDPSKSAEFNCGVAQQ